MISEEFYHRILKWEAEEAHWEGLYQSFSEILTSGLIEIVYDFVPWLAKNKTETAGKLDGIVQKYIRESWNCFESAYHDFFHQEKIEKIFKIPEPLSKDESAKQLKERLVGIPEEDHEFISEFHWELFNKRKHHEGFISAVYNKIKEAFAENYAPYIAEFDGDGIRSLDSEIYIKCAEWFVDDVYKLVPRGSRGK